MRGFGILCQSPPFRILFCFATTPHFRLKRAAISQRCRGPFFCFSPVRSRPYLV
nr:MAG TPA: hypothetical protein [Caudoviricetes sp.]